MSTTTTKPFAKRVIEEIISLGEVPMEDLLERMSCTKPALNGVMKQLRENGIVLEDEVFYFRGDATTASATVPVDGGQTTEVVDASASALIGNMVEGENSNANANATTEGEDTNTVGDATNQLPGGEPTVEVVQPQATTTATTPAAATEEKKGNAPRADSRMSQAKEIYAQMFDADPKVRRKDIITRLKTDLGMTDAGAATYVQTIRTWRKANNLPV